MAYWTVLWMYDAVDFKTMNKVSRQRACSYENAVKRFFVCTEEQVELTSNLFLNGMLCYALLCYAIWDFSG